ncbi:hypothetical protein MFRU_039g00600 [Monilinia fructicola]|uniref:Altered inheritance of mitochondria protein 6 n=1 Tax=Monilinia fructicola TaxID=38448 RepID=A0A5M9JDY3_MONFR|nr:hypothetical protein EYC84_008722 [Monilinia fructicola]KAG4026582.1 hypothetical protein MFRU_039g00600 [Monilinia fructicola]
MPSLSNSESDFQSGIRKVINAYTSPSTSNRSSISPPTYWYPNFTTSIIPISCWSHNDEHQPIPLYTALAAGCIAIEADCFVPSHYPSSWLPFSRTPDVPKNDLLVGHETSELQPAKTLSALYLKPILEILTQQNKAAGNPKKKVGVWDENPHLSLHLTIDYKTVCSGRDGIAILDSLLEPLRHAGFLTYYDTATEKLVAGPLTIVGTGDADFDLICEYSRIEIFKDARFFNFLPAQNPSNSLYVSANISTSIGRFSTSKGPSKRQVEIVRRECREVRERGLIPRYWGTPDDEEWWRVLVESGVEVLNCDDLERGGRWLREVVVNGVGVGALWKEDVKEGEEEGWERASWGGCMVS